MFLFFTGMPYNSRESTLLYIDVPKSIQKDAMLVLSPKQMLGQFKVRRNPCFNYFLDIFSGVLMSLTTDLITENPSKCLCCHVFVM